MCLSFAGIVCVPPQHYQRLLFTIILSLTLSACSDSSSNSAEISEIAETTETDNIINGYHFVSSTSYNEHDQITRTTEVQYNLDLNRIDFVTTDFGPPNTGMVVADNAPLEFIDTSTHREYYDDSGRPTLQEWPSNSTLNTHVYSFDSAGLLTTIEVSGTYSATSDFEYNTSGDLVRVVRNSYGKWEDNTDSLGVDTDTYEYDANGNLITGVRKSESYYDDDLYRTTTNTTTFTYNSQGQRIQSDTVSSEEEDYLLKLINKYDGNGNLVERISQDWYRYERTVFTYEANKEPIFNLWLLRAKFFPLR